jgi:hypothetical protein
MEGPVITKKYLKEYSQLLEEIEGEQERLETIIQKMSGSSIGIGDGMPHGNVKEKDMMALQIDKKDSIEKRLEVLYQEEKEKREYIESQLLKVKDPQERRIIRLHYIDRMEWIEVRSTMFGKRKDYYEEEEKYERLIFRIHGNVLEKLKHIKNISK